MFKKVIMVLVCVVAIMGCDKVPEKPDLKIGDFDGVWSLGRGQVIINLAGSPPEIGFSSGNSFRVRIDKLDNTQHVITFTNPIDGEVCSIKKNWTNEKDHKGRRIYKSYTCSLTCLDSPSADLGFVRNLLPREK